MTRLLKTLARSAAFWAFWIVLTVVSWRLAICLAAAGMAVVVAYALLRAVWFCLRWTWGRIRGLILTTNPPKPLPEPEKPKPPTKREQMETALEAYKDEMAACELIPDPDTKDAAKAAVEEKLRRKLDGLLR